MSSEPCYRDLWQKAEARADQHRPARTYTWGQRWAMFAGKVRRFYYGVFRRGYLERQHAARKGDCIRCGACCKLLYECPFLSVDHEGFYFCTVHNLRPMNCRMYPVNKRDITERDNISPDHPCGYRFD